MRSVELDHPLVTAYLARLEAVATPLPETRRVELLADIRDHLAEALAEVPPGSAGSVGEVLERLGAPEDIVAAELADVDAVGRATVPPVPTAAPPGSAPVAGSGWGPLEIAAVLLLTVGHVVLWVVGPLTGLALAWMSPRWTRREKVVATLWTALPLALVVAAAVFLVTARASAAVPMNVGVAP